MTRIMDLRVVGLLVVLALHGLDAQYNELNLQGLALTPMTFTGETCSNSQDCDKPSSHLMQQVRDQMNAEASKFQKYIGAELAKIRKLRALDLATTVQPSRDVSTVEDGAPVSSSNQQTELHETEGITRADSSTGIVTSENLATATTTNELLDGESGQSTTGTSESTEKNPDTHHRGEPSTAQAVNAASGGSTTQNAAPTFTVKEESQPTVPEESESTHVTNALDRLTTDSSKVKNTPSDVSPDISALTSQPSAEWSTSLVDEVKPTEAQTLDLTENDPTLSSTASPNMSVESKASKTTIEDKFGTENGHFTTETLESTSQYPETRSFAKEDVTDTTRSPTTSAWKDVSSITKSARQGETESTTSTRPGITTSNLPRSDFSDPTNTLADAEPQTTPTKGMSDSTALYETQTDDVVGTSERSKGYTEPATQALTTDLPPSDTTKHFPPVTSNSADIFHSTRPATTNEASKLNPIETTPSTSYETTSRGTENVSLQSVHSSQVTTARTPPYQSPTTNGPSEETPRGPNLPTSRQITSGGAPGISPQSAISNPAKATLISNVSQIIELSSSETKIPNVASDAAITATITRSTYMREISTETSPSHGATTYGSTASVSNANSPTLTDEIVSTWDTQITTDQQTGRSFGIVSSTKVNTNNAPNINTETARKTDTTEPTPTNPPPQPKTKVPQTNAPSTVQGSTNEEWRTASNNLQYIYFSKSVNYSEANQSCNSIDSRLASTGVRNSSTLREILKSSNLTKAQHHIWVGLERIQDHVWTWNWADGVSWDNSIPGWGNNQPDRVFYPACGLMSHNYRKLIFDRNCTRLLSFICEATSLLNVSTTNQNETEASTANTTVQTPGSNLTKNGWIKANNSLWYKNFDENKTFDDAEEFCRQRGAHLAAKGIRDFDVKRDIINQLNITAEVWVGLKTFKTEQWWRWTDSTLWNGSHPGWNDGHPLAVPTTKCGRVYATISPQIASSYCHKTNPYLCERNGTANGTAIPTTDITSASSDITTAFDETTPDNNVTKEFILFMTTESPTNASSETRKFYAECGSTSSIKIFRSWFGHRPRCGNTCEDMNLTANVSSICDGQRTCAIDDFSQRFGDPCPNRVKFLVVIYNCYNNTSAVPAIDEMSKAANETLKTLAEIFDQTVNET